MTVMKAQVKLLEQRTADIIKQGLRLLPRKPQQRYKPKNTALPKPPSTFKKVPSKVGSVRKGGVFDRLAKQDVVSRRASAKAQLLNQG